MSTVAVAVDLVINTKSGKASVQIQRVTDSVGQDRTAEFNSFCSSQRLPSSSQSEIEVAAVEFAKARPASLP